MKQKINYVKIWWGFTLGFFMVAWLVLIYALKLEHWTLGLTMFIYLFANMFIFNGFYLGMCGNLYYRLGQTEKAIKAYRFAIKKNTHNVPALINYSVELLKVGRAQEALDLLKKADTYNTNLYYDKTIMLTMGSCYWVLSRVDDGIEILEKLRNKYSYVNPSVYTSLGYLYILKKDYENAMDCTTKALADNPEYAPAWDNLGQIYYFQQETDKAKEAFEKAISFRATMVDSLYYLGLIAKNSGDKELAREYLERALKCNISAMNTIKKEDIEKALKKLTNY